MPLLIDIKIAIYAIYVLNVHKVYDGVEIVYDTHSLTSTVWALLNLFMNDDIKYVAAIVPV